MTDVERARSALNYFNAGCSREKWVRIGMAAKSAGLAFEDFHSWSKDAENYTGEADCKSAWKSFDEFGSVKAGTLFYMAYEQGWKDTARNYTNANHHSDEKRHCRKENKSQHSDDKAPKKNVLDIWDICTPALSTHGYIVRKGGIPDGLRVYPESASPLSVDGQNIAGYLVVPCLADDQLQTLQFIPPGIGKKLNLGGASFNDGFYLVGKINEETKSIYLCESIGNAWSINKAINEPSVVFFGSGRMLRVAKVIRAKYPNVRLVLVPDRGIEVKAAEIAAAIFCQWVELPIDKPKNYDVNDYAQEFGCDELARLLTNLKSPDMRYKLLSGADLFGASPMRWIVQGVIPVEGLTALYGASGSGKSFLILDMAFAIAAGEKRWFGCRINQAPVTYVCLEGESGMGKRVKASSLYFNKPVPEALRFVVQSFNLLTDDILELAKAITSAGCDGGLVVIDTLNRSAPGADENSSVDMGNIIAAAKKLQNLIGGAVLLVHHTGKDATKGLRGHSSLFAALDGAIEVIKTDTRREWCVAKSKDDTTGNSNPFKLEVVKVGLDDEGQEITSCVALFDDSKEAFQQKKTSLGRNQKIALEEIDRQLSYSIHSGKEEAPPMAKCIPYDETVSRVAERMPTDAKHRKTRAISAIGGLVERKCLGMKGDWLWRI